VVDGALSFNIATSQARLNLQQQQQQQQQQEDAVRSKC
jgi:hypothetical protein